MQTRHLLFVEKGNLIPAPFLAVLVFWLVIIFASFSLFASLNPSLLAFLALFALSAEAEPPRLPTGKLYKRLLRDRYWKDHKTRID